jgi:hypothetical protein
MPPMSSHPPLTVWRWVAAVAAAVLLAGNADAQSIDPPMPKLSPARSAAPAETATPEVPPPGDGPAELQGANSVFAAPAEGDSSSEALPFAEGEDMELRPGSDTMLTYPSTEGSGDGLPVETAEPALAPDAGPPSSIRPGTFTLEARLAAAGPPLGNGVKWRIFGDQPGPNGHLPLLGEADGGIVYIRLDQGAYYVHAAYGRAGATRKIAVDGPTGGEVLVLNAGGMRLLAINGEDQQLAPGDVTFDIFAPEEGGSAERFLLVPDAPPGRIIALNAGTYHVVSKYGDANATIRADVRVDPGKLTETTLFQKAARLTLKLVQQHGGEAIADTAWSVVTPGGESVFESVGAFPTVVLAEGDYTAIAKHDERIFQANFSVRAGLNREVEVTAD